MPRSEVSLLIYTVCQCPFMDQQLIDRTGRSVLDTLLVFEPRLNGHSTRKTLVSAIFSLTPILVHFPGQGELNGVTIYYTIPKSANLMTGRI